MLRTALLVLFAALPLFAAAHEGHRGAQAEAPAPASAALIGTISVASSRCPGGDHEVCCCHDLTATTPSQPCAVADGGWRELAPRLPMRGVPHGDERIAPRAAFIHFDTRGPPLLS